MGKGKWAIGKIGKEQELHIPGILNTKRPAATLGSKQVQQETGRSQVAALGESISRQVSHHEANDVRHTSLGSRSIFYPLLQPRWPSWALR